MVDQLINGPLHHSALQILKGINRTICYWQSRRYQALAQNKPFQQGLPSRQRVVLLVPHMDDEIIGCAGLIAHYHRLGARITCIYLTDSSVDRTGYERLAYISSRLRETKAAGSALGIRQTYFFNQPDGRLRENPVLIEKIGAILDKEKPELLLMPYPRDPHPDHRTTAFLAAKALLLSKTDGIAPYFFQLRAPIPLEQIDMVLDISNFLDSKRALLRGYRTQSQFIFDLALHVQCCQGVLLGRACRAVEVFAAAPLDHLAAMSDDSMQIKRHLHVGVNALRWRGWTMPEKTPAQGSGIAAHSCS